MAALTEEQAKAHMHKLLAAMSQAGGSDLFIANDFPPSMKAHGDMQPMSSQKLTGEITRLLAHSIMNEEQRADFAKEMECNFAISIPGLSRFRMNVFVQQQNVGMVIRTIAAEIPNFEKLDLPPILKEVIMNKRGPGAGCRRHGLWKVDLTGSHDRLSQQHFQGAYHHGGRPGGICAPVQTFAHYSPRGWRGHA
jgi:hypothetical protein